MPAKTYNENIAALTGYDGILALRSDIIRDVLLSVVPCHGRLHISTPAATTIGDTVNFFKVAGATTGGNLFNMDMPADNRLRYLGEPDIHVHVAVSLGLTTAASNVVVGARVGKNGDPTESNAVASNIEWKIGTGADVRSTSIHYDGMMSTNDYLEVFVKNSTSATNITVPHMYFFVLGMMKMT